MKASLYILGPLTALLLIVLGGCSSSILHKDGAKEVVREGVTEPLVGVIDDKTGELIDILDKRSGELIEQIDDLELPELVESSKELMEQTQKSMAKLTELVEEVKKTAEVSTETLSQITETLKTISDLVSKLEATAESSTALINTANELLVETKTLIPELRKVAENTNAILPEIRNLIANLNETVEGVKSEVKSGTTDSVWVKILPSLGLLLGVLIAAFFIVRAIKK